MKDHKSEVKKSYIYFFLLNFTVKQKRKRPLDTPERKIERIEGYRERE